MYIRDASTSYFLYGNFANIRLSIFLITGVFVGFPALLWALRVLYHHYKTESKISFISIFLLLSDLLELIMSPVLVTNICIEYSACYIVNISLFGARLCGHLFHQLVALEYILIHKYPSLAGIFSPACTITLSTFVYLIAIGFQFIQSQITDEINMCFCVMPVFMCAVTCFLTCKAPPNTNQTTERKPSFLVISITIFTLIILYVPFFFYLPFELHSLASMRLIVEPILCVLVCREKYLSQTRRFVAEQ